MEAVSASIRWAVIISVAFVTMGSSPAPKPSAAAAAAPVEPLPAREGPQPFRIVRALSELQERIVVGDADALLKQGAVAGEIARQIRKVDAKVWTDQRNRYGLIRYVLSGGDPALLDGILEAKAVPTEEQALAEGALAFALGDRSAAHELLGDIDPYTLDPSLAGHIALIKAVLIGEADPVLGLQLNDDARLLSPGTVVEETAHRNSIDLAIYRGDQQRFVVSVTRYLFRFPNSMYATMTDRRVARVLGALDLGELKKNNQLATALENQLSGKRREVFFGALAEAALRAGKMTTAAYAGQRAAEGAAVGSPAMAWAKAIEGAALVVGENRAKAFELLDQAVIPQAPPSLDALIKSARALGNFIASPPEEAEKASTSPKSSLVAGRTGGGINRVPDLAERAQSKLSESEKLLEKDKS